MIGEQTDHCGTGFLASLQEDVHGAGAGRVVGLKSKGVGPGRVVRRGVRDV